MPLKIKLSVPEWRFHFLPIQTRKRNELWIFKVCLEKNRVIETGSWRLCNKMRKRKIPWAHLLNVGDKMKNTEKSLIRHPKQADILFFAGMELLRHFGWNSSKPTDIILCWDGILPTFSIRMEICRQRHRTFVKAYNYINKAFNLSWGLNYKVHVQAFDHLTRQALAEDQVWYYLADKKLRYKKTEVDVSFIGKFPWR